MNIDEETSIVGLACDPVQYRHTAASSTRKRIRLGLRWMPGTAPGLNDSGRRRRGLEPGDIIQGSAAWNCQGGDFLLEIVEVLGAATAVDPVCTIVTRPISHLDVVRDMCIDLRLPQSDILPGDRRLTSDWFGAALTGSADLRRHLHCQDTSASFTTKQRKGTSGEPESSDPYRAWSVTFDSPHGSSSFSEPRTGISKKWQCICRRNLVFLCHSVYLNMEELLYTRFLIHG